MQDLFDKFETFAVPDLPPNKSAVYVVLCIKDGKKIPIYVGETKDLCRRIGNYISGYLKQRTDFKVGEAIRYLQGKYEVVIRHKKASEEPRMRKEEEKRIIENLCGEGYILLNHGLKYYDLKNPNIEEEKQKIKCRCDDILKTFANRSHSC